jgi:aspartyl-tRNA(Asn)/glutamyl-tRNA(Gln) amidotransferase subunit C
MKNKKIINEEVVRSVASLARINLQAAEVKQLTKNLEDILHYVAKLEQLDVSRIQPTSHVLPLENVYREDIVKPSLSQQEALSIGPYHTKGHFNVPKVIA